MRYVAAYLLAVLGGNEHPTEADIKKILSSVGIDTDAESVKKVVAQLKGKNLEQLIAEGPSALYFKLFITCFNAFVATFMEFMRLDAMMVYCSSRWPMLAFGP